MSTPPTGERKRWYERLGMQVNHPPPEPARPYVRPSRLTYVVPARVALPLSIVVYVGLLGLLLLAGLDLTGAAPIALFATLAAQWALDGWWRRNRPPSADARRVRPFSKDPADYR